MTPMPILFALPSNPMAIIVAGGMFKVMFDASQVVCRGVTERAEPSFLSIGTLRDAVALRRSSQSTLSSLHLH
jgi:hypothetical protein